METKKMHPRLAVRLIKNEKCFGPGIAALLLRVEELHSLRSAAADMSMAYSKAWTILRQAEQELGFKLLESSVGGKNGGGASLTEQARQLLAAYQAYTAELEAENDRLFQKHFKDFL